MFFRRERGVVDPRLSSVLNTSLTPRIDARTPMMEDEANETQGLGPDRNSDLSRKRPLKELEEGEVLESERSESDEAGHGRTINHKKKTRGKRSGKRGAKHKRKKTSNSEATAEPNKRQKLPSHENHDTTDRPESEHEDKDLRTVHSSSKDNISANILSSSDSTSSRSVSPGSTEQLSLPRTANRSDRESILKPAELTEGDEARAALLWMYVNHGTDDLRSQLSSKKMPNPAGRLNRFYQHTAEEQDLMWSFASSQAGFANRQMKKTFHQDLSISKENNTAIVNSFEFIRFVDITPLFGDPATRKENALAFSSTAFMELMSKVRVGKVVHCNGEDVFVLRCVTNDGEGPSNLPAPIRANRIKVEAFEDYERKHPSLVGPLPNNIVFCKGKEVKEQEHLELDIIKIEITRPMKACPGRLVPESRAMLLKTVHDRHSGHTKDAVILKPCASSPGAPKLEPLKLDTQESHGLAHSAREQQLYVPCPGLTTIGASAGQCNDDGRHQPVSLEYGNDTGGHKAAGPSKPVKPPGLTTVAKELKKLMK